MKHLKLRDVFKDNENTAEINVNEKYYLFVERNYDPFDKNGSLTEVCDQKTNDYIATIDLGWSLNTRLDTISFDKIAEQIENCLNKRG